MFYTGPEHDFFYEVFGRYLKSNPEVGTNKKAADLNAAKHEGYLKGLEETLATYGTDLRVEHIEKLNLNPAHGKIMIPAIEPWVLSDWTRKIRSDYQIDVFKNTPSSELWHMLRNKFVCEVVFTKEFNEEYERLRKRAVLAGYIEPEVRDRHWIKEELDEVKTVAGPLESLLRKIEGE